MRMLQMTGWMVVAASALSAQTFSQPVREIEKEARSAVRGYCANQVLPAGSAGTSGTCLLIPLSGGSGLTTIPADKILVIEDVNISCNKNSADTLVLVRLQPSLYFRDFAPSLRYTSPNGHQTLIGSYQVRMYGRPGTDVGFSFHFGGNTTSPAGCRVDFVGHFVNAQ